MIGAAGLWTAAPGMKDLTLILFFLLLALIGAEFTTVFTNSLLPQLGSKDEIGRISGSGWAMGYWGGLTSLIIVLGLIAPIPGAETTMLGLSPIFGLDPAEGEGARATGPMSAIWYLVFMIPYFLWTPDAAPKVKTSGAVGVALGDLKRTLLTLPSRGSLFAYLMSSMFYRDALNGLYIFGGIYAAGVLGWGTFQLGIFGIIAAFTGAIGAWFGGRADERYGPKPVIAFTIVALMLVAAVTIATGPDEVLFIAVGAPDAPSSLPTIVFYICGAVIGAAGGSLQSASRTMLVRQAEEGRMGEAFGIYALAGKATSFLAPAAIALVTDFTGSQRIGVTPVLALFAIGLILLIWVRPDGQDALQDRGAVAT
ncbi:MAG: MFS transporter [Pseudomonadota bacterium]